MKNKVLFVISFIIMGILVFSACAPQPTAEPEPAEKANAWGREMPADAAPPEQQVLTLPCIEGKSMDISANFYDSHRGCGAVFIWERLVMLDANNKAVPGVATDWSLSADGLTWTFNLRKDAKWSDGSPVTAGDFEYSLKRQLTPATGSTFTWFYGDIKNASKVSSGELGPEELGVKAVDDYTLEVTTEAKTLYLPEVMAFPTSAPVPKKVVEEVGAGWADDPATCLTNGPWKMTEYTPGVQIVLEPNEYYTGEHPALIEKFIMKLGDGVSDFPAYQAGEVEGLFVDQDVTPVSPDTYRMVKEDAILRRELYAYPYFATRWIDVNPSFEPFDDMKVRQAIAHAIDRQALIDVIYDGLGVPAYGLLPAGFPAYVDGALDQYQEFDVEMAQSLLAEAGFPGGAGFPEIEFSYKNDDDGKIRTAEMVQSMLKENLGITLKMRPLEPDVYNNDRGQGLIQFGVENWEFDYVDPSNFLNIYNPDLGGRHKWWNNAEFNALTIKAAGWDNPEERIKMYEQANELLSKEAGGIFLYNWGHAQMWKPYVKGQSVNSLGYARVPYYHLGMHDLYVTTH